MPRATIVEVTNLAKEIEEEMHAPRRSRQFQPLSDNEDSDEESTKDEQKKQMEKS